jgi:hypothetical protein
MKRLLVALLLAAAPASAQMVNGSSGGGAGLVTVGGNGSCCGGATTETNLLALKVPAGSMGVNGMINLKCLWGYPNNANTKTLTVRYSATSGSVSAGGVVAAVVNVTTTVATQTEINIRNTAANVQTMYGPNPTTPFGSSATASVATAVDTTADSYVNVNGITAVGTDTISAHCVALVMRAP